VYVRASFDPSLVEASSVQQTTALAYVAAECKTNLDKTMFQEASATAHDLKVAIPGSKYLLMCEWLDMTPIRTEATDIDEVIIIRGKRVASNVRASYSSVAGRNKARASYVDYLDKNPLRMSSFARLLEHIQRSFDNKEVDEAEILTRGYF
jgi:hypothetical protein